MLLEYIKLNNRYLDFTIKDENFELIKRLVGNDTMVNNIK